MNRYHWYGRGDINAFFGLMLDNVADLVLAVGLLAAAFGFPADFALRYMVPGTALGVLVGDLLFTTMAFRLAKRTGRNDVTAMPLGLDTPSTFGMVFFVLGPAFLEARAAGLEDTAAARYTWQIGICAIVLSGVFKLACAAGAGWIRRLIPRAGLLGSLAAIAMVLISFLPLLDILRYPVVGLVSLSVILTTLVGRIEAPGRIPGALAALLVGGTMFYLLKWTGVLGPVEVQSIEVVWLPSGWLDAFTLEWITALGDSLKYLPVVIPFALATVVGGIDCTESAAAAGDEYHTGHIIAVEAVATLVAGLCGGVIQTTPYIGHPAYKAMGGRAAYTLATALFIGSAGTIGYFGYLYEIIPRAAIFPILIFVGLEITSQSFHATPVRHFPAVVLACVPAMAYLVMIFADNLLTGRSLDDLSAPLATNLQTLRSLSAGFIVTSLLWASATAAIIDRRLLVSASFFAACSVFSLFGVMHSPLAGGPLIVPWNIPELPAVAAGQGPLEISAGYAAVAVLLAAWGWYERRRAETVSSVPQGHSDASHLR